ncbi:hypothetical protein ISS37_07555 [candidate division KSB1 bacterium]|nr:hypothetical protein [candidate division KSB1 bacterium]
MWEQIPEIWQGVLASITGAVIIAIVVKLWSLSSGRARVSRERRQFEMEQLRARLSSPDSVARVEGYFIALFTLLKYLFFGSILWVVAWTLSVLPWIWCLPVAAVSMGASLVAYYLGVRWLYSTLRSPSPSHAGGELEIHSAQYGVPGHYVDVLEQVLAQVQGAQVEVYAGNHLAGDPCPNTVKELVVEYTYRDERRTRRVTEGHILSLP